MQEVIKNICKVVGEEKQIDEKILQSISSKVFHTLNKEIKMPSKLILNIHGIGKFYLGLKKLKESLDRKEGFFTEETEEEMRKRYPGNYDFKKKQYKTLCERLVDYDRYIEDRDRIKAIRNLTQPFIFKKRDEDDN